MVLACTKIRLMLFSLSHPRRLQAVLRNLPNNGNTRCNELGGFGIVRFVLADRADGRSTASRKYLVLASITLFAECVEPLLDIMIGKEVEDVLRSHCAQRLQRTVATHATCIISAFLGMSCKHHQEQCVLAEFFADRQGHDRAC
jgi:hypothetical protein